MQIRMDKSIGHKDQVYGGFAFQSIRADNTNLFGFLDTTDTLGINANINWQHRLNQDIFSIMASLQPTKNPDVSLLREPHNVSGDAGVTGNLQDPTDWGPPHSPSPAASPVSRTPTAPSIATAQTESPNLAITVAATTSPSAVISAGRSSTTSLSKTLEATSPLPALHPGTRRTTGGSDFADFLIGVPDTSPIAYGNADKYFRQSVYDAYATDDWRIRPELTINAGLRWEYGAPITETHGRIVNLDIAPGFTAVAPVLGSDPTGPITGQQYPTSLIHPDKLGIEPRIGISWRPIPGSSVVVRAGYGIYDDTSVYQSRPAAGPAGTALHQRERAEQPFLPPDTRQWIQPLFLHHRPTFAVDPNFRVGYAQTWQLSVQRDLPASLQMTATYLGIKGTRGVQQFLPNTYPLGATNPCPSAPQASCIKPRAETRPVNRAASNCAADCAPASPQPAIHLLEVDRQRRHARRPGSSQPAGAVAPPAAAREGGGEGSGGTTRH